MYKLKGKSVLFFSTTRLSSFHCPPFSILCAFTWLGGGLKLSDEQSAEELISELLPE